jgi:hypothetical protein
VDSRLHTLLVWLRATLRANASSAAGSDAATAANGGATGSRSTTLWRLRIAGASRLVELKLAPSASAPAAAAPAAAAARDGAGGYASPPAKAAAGEAGAASSSTGKLGTPALRFEPLVEPSVVAGMVMAAGPAMPAPAATAAAASGSATAGQEPRVGQKRPRAEDAPPTASTGARAAAADSEELGRAAKAARRDGVGSAPGRPAAGSGAASSASAPAPAWPPAGRGGSGGGELGDGGGGEREQRFAIDPSLWSQVTNIPIPPGGQPPVSLAIIVPFRDQPEQNRGEQLRRFSEHMPAFLESVAPKLENYHVFIIEQSTDGYKFNRGKTLNIGFALASDPAALAQYGIPGARFNSFCFHDVDLLPAPKLGPWYGRYPSGPVCIGSAWARYQYDTYVGGVITMSEAAFRRVNGYPNTYWGWGGEDDELFSRMYNTGLLPIVRPGADFAGALTDLEDELIKARGGVRAGWKVSEGGMEEFRCMKKRENREARRQGEAGRAANGLTTLDYAVVATRRPNPRVTVFTVDLRGGADPFSEKLSAKVAGAVSAVGAAGSSAPARGGAGRP